jgi:DNA-binding NtrC family response regulator
MHILCISDDPILAVTRSEILRLAHHNVVSCPSASAWRTFINGDFDAVLLCTSVPLFIQLELVAHMSKRSPSLVIIRCDEDQGGDTPNVVHVPQFHPEAMLAAVQSSPNTRVRRHG